MNRTANTCVVIVSVALLGFGAMLIAGPLNPPVGPIASSYKTLGEVEPRIAINATNTPGDPIGDPSPSLFKITQPGSYYLTGNIVGEIGKHGIEIVTSGVTIDLGGFDISGVPGMGYFSGITVTAIGLTNITVKNGSVRNWEGEAGVDMTGVFINSNCRVEGVVASGNASGSGNLGAGIILGPGGLAVNCSAHNNQGNGIRVTTGGTVSNCSASNNTGSGINVGTGCLVTECVLHLNALDGIRCGLQCVVRGNVCSNNGAGAGSGAGVRATGADNRIEGNNCTNADRGIDVDGAGCIIFGNTCSSNTINWEIATGNSVGPIIVAGTNAAIISGNGPVASTLGSSDPFANFSF